MRFLIAALLWAQAAVAQDVLETARAMYPESISRIEVVETITGHCGATKAVNQRVAYCTSRNRIYVAEAAEADASMPYEIAHQLGHMIFVRNALQMLLWRQYARIDQKKRSCGGR